MQQMQAGMHLKNYRKMRKNQNGTCKSSFICISSNAVIHCFYAAQYEINMKFTVELDKDKPSLTDYIYHEVIPDPIYKEPEVQLSAWEIKPYKTKTLIDFRYEEDGNYLRLYLAANDCTYANEDYCILEAFLDPFLDNITKIKDQLINDAVYKLIWKENKMYDDPKEESKKDDKEPEGNGHDEVEPSEEPEDQNSVDQPGGNGTEESENE